MKSIIKYFKEPFQEYDGEWKGIYYYDEMRGRRNTILGIVWMIAIFIFAAGIGLLILKLK